MKILVNITDKIKDISTLYRQQNLAVNEAGTTVILNKYGQKNLGIRPVCCQTILGFSRGLASGELFINKIGY